MTAIDFETACPRPASACAVGLARIRDGAVTETFYSLIKPPPEMGILPYFTSIHGLTNQDVACSPTFEELWPALQDFIGSDSLCAHNASFDQGVLEAALSYYNIKHDPYYFHCTVRASRKKWPRLYNHKLHTVSDYLGIELNHHEALSDAVACAKIWLRANS